MQNELYSFRLLVEDYNKADLIYPEAIGAKDGSQALLDLNIKTEMAKHFLRQALDYMESSNKMLLRMIEDNLPPEKKEDIQYEIDNFIAHVSSPKALDDWEDVINKKFNLPHERTYIAAKLAEYLKYLK